MYYDVRTEIRSLTNVSHSNLFGFAHCKEADECFRLTPFVASHTNTKSPTTSNTAGRMQAEKHRSVLSGSCLKPGVQPIVDATLQSLQKSRITSSLRPDSARSVCSSPAVWHTRLKSAAAWGGECKAEERLQLPGDMASLTRLANWPRSARPAVSEPSWCRRASGLRIPGKT